MTIRADGGGDSLVRCAECDSGRGFWPSSRLQSGSVNFSLAAGKRRLRRYAFDLMGRFTPVVAVDGPSGRLLLDTADRVVGRSAYVNRGYQEARMARALSLLEAEGFGFDDRTFLDVGANTGVSTVPALRRFRFAAAIAVEPSPNNCALLYATLAVNGLTDRTSVVQAAASNRQGAVALELSPVNSGDHRVRMAADVGALGEERWDVIRVPAITLSDLDFDASPAVGLIWSDTQGHDGHVLCGLKDQLRDVPAVVEFWPYGLRRAEGLGLLYEAIADRFDRVMDCSTERWMPSDEVELLEAVYRGQDHTDLIALPR